MKHIKKYNESKQYTKPCPDCGTQVDMYYRPYCPKCDIQDIIKHKRGSYCLIPILRYGEKVMDENIDFDRDKIWDYFCNYEYMKGNDTYFEYDVIADQNVTYRGVAVGQMMKDVLDDLGIDYTKDNGEVLFWVSW